ncbi:MAG TPA: radical SAM protein, partial [bacterium]|nr:radical SAM protein [bacterium]
MKTYFLLVSVAGVPKILSDFIPDIGMASLAASLIEHGHKVKILDLNLPSLCSEIITPDIKETLEKFSKKVFIENEKPGLMDIFVLKRISRHIEKAKKNYCNRLKIFLSELVERENVRAVGFKLWAGEGFTWSLEAGKYLKKKHPGVKVFGGGPQVDIFGQDIYKAGDFFDALCYCEGEESITQLANFVHGGEKLENIPNIIFRGKSGETVKTPRKHIYDLDSLPLPVYSPEVYVDIGKKLKMLILEESRGCPNSCNFCIHPVKSGKRRTKSVQKVINEIKEYGKRYGVRIFKYAGSSTPGCFMEEVARKIIEEKIDIKYTGFGHVNDFNVDFALLKQSGCESIFFGVESANEQILKKGMNKNLRKEDMERVLQKCKQSGIFTVASIIYPAPFETEETGKETLNFMKKV